MMPALRALRLIGALMAAAGFAIIGASRLTALLTRMPGTGFLGAAEPAVFIVACVLVVAAVISIPYLRETMHPGVPPGSTARKSAVARVGEDIRR
jgi:hypothetical protein